MKHDRVQTIAPSDDDGARMIVTLTKGELQKIVFDAVSAALERRRPELLLYDDDGLVNADKAAEYLAVSKAWLYKNSDRLPFAKKVGGARRFDRRGMRRWLESERR
jgi:Helix-turn-helix domain